MVKSAVTEDVWLSPPYVIILKAFVESLYAEPFNSLDENENK